MVADIKIFAGQNNVFGPTIATPSMPVAGLDMNKRSVVMIPLIGLGTFAPKSLLFCYVKAYSLELELSVRSTNGKKNVL